MTQDKKQKLIESLRGIAEAMEMQHVEGIYWRGKYGSNYFSTKFGFVFFTEANMDKNRNLIIDISYHG